MFAIDPGGGLWEVSTTGLALNTASTGLTLIPNQIGLSNNSSTLYLSDGPYLYTVNTSTGAATQVDLPLQNPSVQILPAPIGSMLFESGTLYGVANNSNESVYDLTSDVPSSASVNTGDIFGYVIGLAPDPLSSPAPVPEPESLVLLVTSLALIGMARAVRPRARRERARVAAGGTDQRRVLGLLP